MTTLRFTSIQGRTEEIVQSIMESPEVFGVPDLEFTIHLVAEEIVSNIVNYAYEDPSVGTLDVEIEKADKEIVLKFIDKGKPFNPLEKEDPDTSLSVEERPIGGLGIYLVKQMMSNVVYEHVGDKNVLRIQKRLE